ncbi:predicted protein [Plenodomus lingam JN3]|uniref:Predicted protein n=1 Tax=Leptosphaeria maculans (strain JN3 / isolate v23.1.3 / race Av1-4-5-6-7-8) TaxID=985895 RepID=E4ZYP8_LEPMJ|nr:predicted protein [Plenodomus lingam JN3]CBX96574.1 predicted protein [Plenodomus lingam JN3]
MSLQFAIVKTHQAFKASISLDPKVRVPAPVFLDCEYRNWSDVVSFALISYCRTIICAMIQRYTMDAPITWIVILSPREECCISIVTWSSASDGL